MEIEINVALLFDGKILPSEPDPGVVFYDIVFTQTNLSGCTSPTALLKIPVNKKSETIKLTL